MTVEARGEKKRGKKLEMESLLMERLRKTIDLEIWLAKIIHGEE